MFLINMLLSVFMRYPHISGIFAFYSSWQWFLSNVVWYIWFRCNLSTTSSRTFHSIWRRHVWRSELCGSSLLSGIQPTPRYVTLSALTMLFILIAFSRLSDVDHTNNVARPPFFHLTQRLTNLIFLLLPSFMKITC